MLFGSTALQQLGRLPPFVGSWGLLLLSFAALWAVFYFASFYSSRLARLSSTVAALVFSAGIGFFGASLVGHGLLATALPVTLEGEDVVVEGLIASLPEPSSSGGWGQRRTRFEFVPDSLHWQGEPQPLPGRLLLSWYQDPPALRVGERWRLTVRLKRPHGFMNPGGFDYEAWLFQQGIRAKGYVREPRRSNGSDQAAVTNQRLAVTARAYPVHQLRQQLRDELQSALHDHPLRGIVLALAIGDRQLIDQDQWQLLMRTGTNHLVAISGLHVGLVAGFAFFAVRRLWRLSATAVSHWPAARAGAVAALLAATVYALLAGFSVPTQRALVMVAVVMLAVLLQRHTRPSALLALALILVLVIDPMAVLAPGFWLSFGAVAVILYAMSGRLAMRSLWWRWGRVQYVVAVGLFPALVLLFQKASLVAPLANLLAVPWVSMVTVPLTLGGTLLLAPLPVVAEWLLGLALWSVDVLWWWLALVGQWRFAQWSQAAPPGWAMAVAVVGLAWVLAPRGVPGRGVGMVGLLPLFFLAPTGLAPGEAQFTLLDVGQGLASVVQTQNHVLVFDTGPRFGSGFNTGEAVIAPYLLAQGRGRIDTLVVSHGDNDHIGGVPALLESLPVQRVLSSELDRRELQQRHGVDLQACVAGQQWQWDGVVFTMLNPAEPESKDQGHTLVHKKGRRENNRSCVLRVQAGNDSVLLSGDIEQAAEQEMLQRLAAQLPADVLVVPHHGSKTSSSTAFVEGVAPAIALFPVGYRNRYGFPKPLIVQRYRDRHIRLFDTASHGAITVRLGGPLGLKQIHTYRQQAARYWHDQPMETAP
ncbi:MAG: DNA internalization-related competence protein ComEC/Rec2 [Gammaproteobacteria bacterium]|nr:DNA internalization-related competence protein ComEC/Rec2 [Gammaproteobacteria bacterium]